MRYDFFCHKMNRELNLKYQQASVFSPPSSFLCPVRKLILRILILLWRAVIISVFSLQISSFPPVTALMICFKFILENSDNSLGSYVKETHCNVRPDPKSIACPPRSSQALQKIWIGSQTFYLCKSLCSTNKNTIDPVNITNTLVTIQQAVPERWLWWNSLCSSWMVRTTCVSNFFTFERK